MVPLMPLPPVGTIAVSAEVTNRVSKVGKVNTHTADVPEAVNVGKLGTRPNSGIVPSVTTELDKLTKLTRHKI